MFLKIEAGHQNGTFDSHICWLTFATSGMNLICQSDNIGILLGPDVYVFRLQCLNHKELFKRVYQLLKKRGVR